MYGHIGKLAQAEKDGLEKVLGKGSVDVYQYVEETSTHPL
jgi:hypothetical protein